MGKTCRVRINRARFRKNKAHDRKQTHDSAQKPCTRPMLATVSHVNGDEHHHEDINRTASDREGAETHAAEPGEEDQFSSDMTTGKNDERLQSFNDIFNTEKAEEEYEAPPTDPMLFTWSGFLEKLGWVGDILSTPCVMFHDFKQNSRLARSRQLEIEAANDTSEDAIATGEEPARSSAPYEETSSIVSDQSSVEDVTRGVLVITTEAEVHNNNDLEESGIKGSQCDNENPTENVTNDSDAATEEIGEGGDLNVESDHQQEGFVTGSTEETGDKSAEKKRDQDAQLLGNGIPVKPGQVSGKTKKKFKKLVRTHVKKCYKSPGVGNPYNQKEIYPNITPKVRRVDRKQNETARIVTVIGNDGYGKTTLMKRYAEMAMGRLLVVNEEIENSIKRWHPFARKDFFKFVHYIDARYLPREGSYTPSQFLLKSTVEDIEDTEADMGFQWLLTYQKSVLFILDEVDETAFSLEDERTINFDEKASPSCILHNFIKGSFLPNAFILVAVKCLDFGQLERVLNPDRTYAILGFDHADTKSFLSKKTDVWKALNGKFPNLLMRSKVPVFLLYSSVAIFNEDFNLDSIIGAMAQYVRRALCHSEDWRPESLKTLTKLKKLAFQATVNGKLMLKDHDRSDVDLSDEIVDNVAMFEAKRKVVNISNGNQEIASATNFIHRTIQDFLTALELCEVDLEEFKKLVTEENRQPFLQALLFEIFLNKNNMQGIKDMVKVLESDEKRDILKRHLRDIVRLRNSKGTKMAIYTLVHDCKDGVEDILHESLRRLQVHDERLDYDALYILSALAGRTGNLEVLEMSTGHLTDDSLQQLYKFLKDKEVKICLLNIRGNPEIAFKNAALIDICRHCKTEELDVSSCHLDNDKAQRLQKISKDIQLKVVRIDDNPQLGEVGFQAIGEFARKCSATKLNLENCSLNEGKAKRLRRSLKGTSLKVLNVSRNKGMGVQTMAVLGMLVQECSIEEINLSKCCCSNKEIRNFQESLDKSKMRILDISVGKTTSASGKEIVAISRLLPHVTEELRMRNWEISERSLKLFEDKINASASPDLKIFFGSMGENVLTRQKSDENA